MRGHSSVAAAVLLSPCSPAAAAAVAAAGRATTASEDALDSLGQRHFERVRERRNVRLKEGNLVKSRWTWKLTASYTHARPRPSPIRGGGRRKSYVGSAEQAPMLGIMRLLFPIERPIGTRISA